MRMFSSRSACFARLSDRNDASWVSVGAAVSASVFSMFVAACIISLFMKKSSLDYSKLADTSILEREMRHEQSSKELKNYHIGDILDVKLVSKAPTDLLSG